MTTLNWTPPYTTDQFMTAAGAIPDNPRLAFGLFVRFIINDAVYRYRNKYHREPTRINLNFEEFEALLYFTEWTDKNLPSHKRSRIDDSYWNTPITQVNFKYDSIPVLISKSLTLIE